MARADLLVSLIKSISQGDQLAVRRAIDGIITDGREHKHHVLADRLASLVREHGEPVHRPGRILTDGIEHLLYHRMPERRLPEIMLSPNNRAVIEQVVEEHHRADLLKSSGLIPRNRLMFIGPPGNGKTTLAEALAHELMVPFLIVRYEG